MREIECVKALNDWDKRGSYLFSKGDLGLIFGEEGNALSSTLRRLERDGVLLRVARGLYAFALSHNFSPTTIQDVAIALRPGHFVYESFESAASQWGLISQIPLDRLTVATTGPSGEFETPFGVVEFTHVGLAPSQIVRDSVDRKPYQPMRIATEGRALKDLLDFNRSVELIDPEEAEALLGTA